MPNRMVYKNEDGMWANKAEGNERASSLHETQAEAIKHAREMMEKDGMGGELSIMGEDGKIRQKDTINAHDPHPPKG